jgi:hypothetical protein
MAPEKEKPAVETVQQTMKLSDLLMVEVCQPIKESTDKIPLCLPYVPGPKLCKPLISCGPIIYCSPKVLCIPHMICRPLVECNPIATCHPCLPYVCSPRFDVPVVPPEGLPGPSPEDYLNMLQAELAQKLTVTELNTLREEVTALKREIAALKNQLKR